MLRVRAVVAVGVCGALLSACGGSTSHTAAINVALQRLQAEFEAQATKPKPRGTNILGSTTLIYAPPPKGVSASEWQTAVRRDQPLQRAISRSSR